MSQMTAPGPAGDKVLTGIAEASQDSLASYKEQLATTHMFYTPASGVQMASVAGSEEDHGSGPPVLLHARTAGR